MKKIFVVLVAALIAGSAFAQFNQVPQANTPAPQTTDPAQPQAATPAPQNQWGPGGYAQLPQSAMDAAKALLPPEANYTGFEFDDGEYEMYFTGNGAVYKAKYSPWRNKIRKIEVDTYSQSVAPQMTLTPQQVQQLVKQRYPGATNIWVTPDREDWGFKYEVKFRTPQYRADIDVNPATGDICDQDYYYF